MRVQSPANVAQKRMAGGHAAMTVPASNTHRKPVVCMVAHVTLVPNAAKKAARPKGPTAAVLIIIVSPATTAAGTTPAHPMVGTAVQMALSARAGKSVSSSRAAKHAAKISPAKMRAGITAEATQVGMEGVEATTVEMFQYPYPHRRFLRSIPQITLRFPLRLYLLYLPSRILPAHRL